MLYALYSGTDLIRIQGFDSPPAQPNPIKGLEWREYTPPAPPPPAAPTSISMRQARLQLAALGVYEAVNAAVVGMGAAAQIEWEYAATVERSNPLTSAMTSMLGWSEAQADDYFMAASML